jgi:ComF family protein
LPGFLHRYLAGIGAVLFPQFCAACGNTLFYHEQVLCLKCLAGLPRTRFHSEPENELARLFWGRVPVRNASAFIYFNEGSHYQHILHEIKYNGHKQAAFELGKLFGSELRGTAFENIDLIHPVPLHPKKHRERGYNQSELIAKGIAAAMCKPVETMLIARLVDTESQTRKSRYERWENVKGIFTVRKPEKLVNCHILMVDDVITTGSTLEACILPLLNLPGISISIASLAYVKLQ